MPLSNAERQQRYRDRQKKQLGPTLPTQAELASERRARAAERRVEELLDERHKIHHSRWCQYNGLLEAIHTIAWFHSESTSDAWDGIASVAGSTDVLDEIDRAQSCLTRLKREHPNANRKPGIVQKLKPG